MRQLAYLIYAGLTGNYRTALTESLDQADCVIMDAFGNGRSNEQMMRYALDMGLPLIFPEILANAYLRLCGESFPRMSRLGNLGPNHNAHDVMGLAIKMMKREGFVRPIVVAHPYEVARCAAVVRKLGIYPIVPPGLHVIGFDPTSDQKRTRWRWLWRLREPLVVIYFRLKYWI